MQPGKGSPWESCQTPFYRPLPGKGGGLPPHLEYGLDRIQPPAPTRSPRGQASFPGLEPAKGEGGKEICPTFYPSPLSQPRRGQEFRDTPYPSPSQGSSGSHLKGDRFPAFPAILPLVRWCPDNVYPWPTVQPRLVLTPYRAGQPPTPPLDQPGKG